MYNTAIITGIDLFFKTLLWVPSFVVWGLLPRAQVRENPDCPKRYRNPEEGYSSWYVQRLEYKHQQVVEDLKRKHKQELEDERRKRRPLR